MFKNVQQLRHALFRVKARLLFQSRVGTILRNSVWEELPRGKELMVIYKRTQEVFKSYDFGQIHDSALISHLVKENKSWSHQDDVIYELEKEVYIEPARSLAFARPNSFVVQTRSKVHKHMVPPARFGIFPILPNKDVKKVQTLIHCDGYAGKNLYHFIDDALNPLLLLLQSKLVDQDLPIVIHEEVYRLPYVQYFIQKIAVLKNCNWLVQKKGEWITSERLYKAISSHVQWTVLYQALAGIHRKNPHRRVFLNRRATFQRTISNFHELVPILEKYKFTVVFAEDLKYEEQVVLFNETQALIAIHGAGISNLIHSEIPKVRLLELFSSSLIQPHFYWVFMQLGLGYYDAIIGSSFNVNWSFSINPNQFEVRVKALVEAA